MKKVFMMIALLAGFAMTPGAFAEPMKAKVVEFNQGARQLQVNYENALTGKSQDVSVNLADAIALSGFKSVSEITPGDEVILEVEPGEAGELKAKAIERAALTPAS